MPIITRTNFKKITTKKPTSTVKAFLIKSGAKVNKNVCVARSGIKQQNGTGNDLNVL